VPGLGVAIPKFMLTPWVASSVAVSADAVPIPLGAAVLVDVQVKLPAPFEIAVASTVNTTPSWVPVYAAELGSARAVSVVVQAPV
jgi:hypothetical protein